jgi:hypothetical protein
MAKDETEIGITGLPIPKKKRSPAKQYEFEKERKANIGKNVGGEKYGKDVTSGYNPRTKTFKEFVQIANEVLDESRGGAASPGTPDSYHKLSRGLKKNKGQKSSYDTEGNMIRKYATMQLKKRKQAPYND